MAIPWWADGACRWALVLAVLAHALLWQVLHPNHELTKGRPRPQAVKVVMKTLAPVVASALVAEAVPTPAPGEPQPATPAEALSEPQAAPASKSVGTSANVPTQAEAPPPSPPSEGVGPSGTRLRIEGLTPERERAILAMVPESYLPIDELDKTPELLGDWKINDAVVPQGKGRPDKITLTLRLWISDQGHIDAYQVLNVQPLVPWVDELLKPLDLSTLRPALRNGDPVAASWTIEFTLDFTGGPWAPRVP